MTYATAQGASSRYAEFRNFGRFFCFYASFAIPFDAFSAMSLARSPCTNLLKAKRHIGLGIALDQTLVARLLASDDVLDYKE